MKGKKTLIQKDPHKGTMTSTYYSITFLPMMGKILIAHLRGKWITRLNAAKYSQNNRKDAVRDQE